MNESQPASVYDWEFIRSWCEWYIDLFLQYGSLDSVAGRRWFYDQHSTREIDWKSVRALSDDSMRCVIEDVSASISEAVATRDALPGDYADAVTTLTQVKALLRQGMTARQTWETMVALGLA